MEYFKGLGSLSSSAYDEVLGLSTAVKPRERTNTPGLMSDVRRASGQFVSGVGSTLRDLGAEGVGSEIEQYGAGVVQRNPSEIRSFDDVLSRPFTTAREAVGEVAPQVGLALGGRALGAIGGGLVGGPVGAAVGGFIGGLLPTAAQTYGGIRTEQRAEGIDERGRALAVTIPAALLERFGGAERVALRVAGEGTEFLQRAAGTGFAKNAGKQFVRGGLEETITEIPQTGLERYGVTGQTADLTSPEAFNEYGVAGAKAFLGGGTVRAGLSSLAGTRKEPTVTVQPNGTITSDQLISGAEGETDLTGGGNVLMTPEQAAQRLQEIQNRRPAPLGNEAFTPVSEIDLAESAGRPVTGELTDMQRLALAGPNAPRPVTGGAAGLTPMQREALLGPQIPGMTPMRQAALEGPTNVPQPITGGAAALTPLQQQALRGPQTAPRPVSGELTPGQQAALAGPDIPRPVSGELTPAQQAALAGPDVSRPVTGELTPGQQAALAGPDVPRPVSGELTPAQQAALAGPDISRSALPTVPAGVTLTADENRIVKQANAIFGIAETDAERASVAAMVQRTIDRAVQRSPAPVTPVGASNAVAAASPAVQATAGVSSTPTTGEPSGTQAPQAVKAETQQAKAPAAPAAPVVEDTAPKNVSEAIKEDNDIDRVLKAVEAEDDKVSKLFASVTGDTKKAPNKPSMPAQVYAAIRNAILNPGRAVVVRKAKSVKKDAAATEKYGAKAKRIAEAATEFAAAYETYASQNLVRSGEVVKRGQTADDVVAGRAAQLKANAAAVQQALAKLGEAVEGNAKDVEAIVRFVKDRAQKEKKGDVKTMQADITLSRAWTAAKSESFMGEPDLLATTGAEVRQSREATARGVTPQLVDAATEGYKIMGKGEAQTGLNGILNYIRTVGTPFEKTLAQAIKLAIKGKAPIKIKFVKEGTSQYDPKTNTITINETSSKEVALHEALHGALQWFVYTNPNAAQVVALKAALQRVVKYDGKLPPKAAEVQALLKKILAGKSKTAELDAVLELVSYGNTLNDFRRALQGMESNAPRTFTKFANDVMDAIYALVRRMLGSSQTVASDVMENTFQLLEAARAATQETAPKKGNVLQAVISTTTDAFKRWFGDSKVTSSGGEAKVIYTGTSKDKDFAAFNVPRNGVWFTEDAASASSYAVENDSIGFKWEGGRPVEVNTASRVIPVFLRIENPYTMTAADMAQLNKENYKKAQGDFFDTLRKQGYDGVKMDGGIWVVIKEPAQIKSAIGNRGTFDPTSGNILKAEVTSLDAAAQQVGWADATAFANGPGKFKTPTQLVFELVGLGRVNGKDLPLTASIAKNGAKLANYIRKEVPTLERVIMQFNSNFSNSPATVAAIDNYKFLAQTGHLQMEKIATTIAARPELREPFLDYMDGNTKAFAGIENASGFKAIADNLKGLMQQYISTLPANSKERRAFESMPFTQYIINPTSISQVAGSTLSAGKIASMVGTKEQGHQSLDEFKAFLDMTDGTVDQDQPLYQMFEEKLGKTLPVGFISKAQYDKTGVTPSGFSVDAKRVWKFSKYDTDKGDFRFSSSITTRDALKDLKSEDLALALVNTTAALAHAHAATTYFGNLASIGREGDKPTAEAVAFDSVDEINEVFGDRKLELNNVLQVSDEASKSQSLRWQTQRTGTWVQLPQGTTYGALAGKIIPGPVWNAMIDMHDRSPAVNFKSFNELMAFFKQSKTVLNPGTHVTNVLSNVALLILHGIRLGTLKRAAGMYANFERNPDSMTDADRALMQAFFNSGAVLGQFTNSELKGSVYDRLSESITPTSDQSYIKRMTSMAAFEQTKAKLTGWKDNAVEIYAAEDNVFRFAAFLETAGNVQLRDGTKQLDAKQLEEIGLASRKMFLDYDIDARAIRAARQTFLPFVSWSYAIMPVLGRIAVTKPWAIVNMMASVMLMQAALGGEEDDELRKKGPDYLRERSLFGLGPYMHMRIPFVGDDQNPTYLNVGKYLPFLSLFQPAPGESPFAGQSWLPGFASPGGPLVTLISAMNGYDPFTGKPMHAPTDTEWDKLVTTGKAAYDTMAPPVVTTKFWNQIGQLKDGAMGPTGVEKSSMFLARTLGGLGLYQFNVDEAAFYKSKELKDIKKDYKAAMTKAKREEYRKGYPDYEALDKELDTLRDRMQEALAKARGEE